jgi:membrane carboxypeptidase/penicillin-binding protein PbpC
MKTIITLISLLVCASAFAQEKAYFGAAGQTVTMTASADGTAPFVYQWFRDGSTIYGTTSAQTFTLSAETAGTYTVKVSNDAGSAMSAPVRVLLIAPPSNVRIEANLSEITSSM